MEVVIYPNPEIQKNPMRLQFANSSLFVELVNHYTTQDALICE